MSTIRVAIVDDQELVRAGFRLILNAEDDIDVVAEAANGEEAVATVTRQQVDVMLMDIRMPGMDGLEATRRLARQAPAPAVPREPGPRIVILTTFQQDDYVLDAVRSGASGFLLKNAPPEELIHAVRVVSRGEALLSPAVTRQVLSTLADNAPAPGAAVQLQELTGRETEVLRAVAAGLSNGEIAERLFLGEATIKTHVSRILTKLNLRDRVQAVVFAYESGLARPGGELPGQ